MSVKYGDVGSVMCSYNRIGGVYACDNADTLTDVLRNQWGFGGYVQSDFGATHSTAHSLNASEDFEMLSPTWYTPARIKAALADGSLSIDTHRPLAQAPLCADVPVRHLRPADGTIDATADGATARAIAEQTAVLLKNNPPKAPSAAPPASSESDQQGPDAGQHVAGKLLPLDASRILTIALVGQATFVNAAVAGGGGSSRVSPLYTVTPLQGLQNVLSSLHSSATVNLVVVANDNSNLAAATAAAANADVTIIMAGVVTSEGSDRPSLSLPNNQDMLISAVAAASPRTVLVLKDGDPVLMPWIDQVPAVLEAWNPGEEDGNVVARLLFGLVNPSGKLPASYPRLANDTPTSTPDRYPGVVENGIPTVHYSEGLEVGYRWYDSQQIQPLFPFGFGLSYTAFRFSGLEVTPETTDGTRPIRVRFEVENTGRRAGAEVAQVYLGLPASAGEPPKRLVAFQKVWLQPDQEKRVQLTIDSAATSHPLSIWDPVSQAWQVVDGKYRVYVGNSSSHMPLSDDFEVRGRRGRDR